MADGGGLASVTDIIGRTDWEGLPARLGAWTAYDFPAVLYAAAGFDGVPVIRTRAGWETMGCEPVDGAQGVAVPVATTMVVPAADPTPGHGWDVVVDGWRAVDVFASMQVTPDPVSSWEADGAGVTPEEAGACLARFAPEDGPGPDEGAHAMACAWAEDIVARAGACADSEAAARLAVVLASTAFLAGYGLAADPAVLGEAAPLAASLDPGRVLDAGDTARRALLCMRLCMGTAGGDGAPPAWDGDGHGPFHPRTPGKAVR